MKFILPAFWGAFIALGFFNAYTHVGNHDYWWLALDALCLFVFSRNFVRSLASLRAG